VQASPEFDMSKDTCECGHADADHTIGRCLAETPMKDEPNRHVLCQCKQFKLKREGFSSPSPKILYPEWQAEYQAALLELDAKRLFERVTTAETAIFNRLQAISHNSDGHAERQAIEDALAALRVLKRDNLGFPDWEKK
jgi:hypothetical protein